MIYNDATVAIFKLSLTSLVFFTSLGSASQGSVGNRVVASAAALATWYNSLDKNGVRECTMNPVPVSPFV